MIINFENADKTHIGWSKIDGLPKLLALIDGKYYMQDDGWILEDLWLVTPLNKPSSFIIGDFLVGDCVMVRAPGLEPYEGIVIGMLSYGFGNTYMIATKDDIGRSWDIEYLASLEKKNVYDACKYRERFVKSYPKSLR